MPDADLKTAIGRIFFSGRNFLIIFPLRSRSNFHSPARKIFAAAFHTAAYKPLRLFRKIDVSDAALDALVKYQVKTAQ